MKKYFFLILVFYLLLNSCGQQYKFYENDECDYYNCESIEPFDAEITIKFSRFEGNENPIIIIKSGYYEQGTVIQTINTDSLFYGLNVISVVLPLNFFYTVETKYITNGDTITVIDGKNVYKEAYIECDSTCWNIKNKHFNVRIKP